MRTAPGSASPQGTLLASPVRAFHAAADHVTLVPHDAWWLGTFYGDDANRPFDTYVDVATPAVWHGEDLVRAVDLDLDVIRGTTGRVWVDDEDEFAEHRVSLGLSRRGHRAGGRPAASPFAVAVEDAEPPSTAPIASGSPGCRLVDTATCLARLGMSCPIWAF